MLAPEDMGLWVLYFVLRCAGARTWHMDSALSALVLRMSQGVWALSGGLGEAEV